MSLSPALSPWSASSTPVPPTAEGVLQEFLDDIESTGGVIRCGVGIFAPAADVTWTALGATYVHACAALGRPPMIELPEDLADDAGVIPIMNRRAAGAGAIFSV